MNIRRNGRRKQYKSAIWCQNEAQYAVAIRMIENLERDGKGRLKRTCIHLRRVP